MARDYFSWNSARNNGDMLQERPSITTTIDNKKRYYSSIDAEIYFGGIFIDEVTNIVWSVQQQALPIYGYNSYCFDDVAVGARLINGQFTINFTEANYLQKIQDDGSLKRMARKLYGKDDPVVSYFKDTLRQRLNKPIWDGGFDIVIGFGDQGKKMTNLNNTVYNTFTVLDCCQITGSTIQLDYSGVPVTETYTFIARDIKTNQTTSEEVDPSTVTGSNGGEIDRSSLNVSGVVDLTGSKAIIKLLITDTVNLQSGTVLFTDNISDKALTSLISLSPNTRGDSSGLYTELDVDKTNRLKNIVKQNNYANLKASTSVVYYSKAPSSQNNSLITSKQNIVLEVKNK